MERWRGGGGGSRSHNQWMGPTVMISVSEKFIDEWLLLFGFSLKYILWILVYLLKELKFVF